MNKEEYFIFLDNIRESGKINMFGAVPYLQDAFSLNRHDARDILFEWISIFAERKLAKVEKQNE